MGTTEGVLSTRHEAIPAGVVTKKGDGTNAGVTDVHNAAGSAQATISEYGLDAGEKPLATAVEGPEPGFTSMPKQ